MKHARTDYNRIQDPSGKIPEDEPVMLFRAQDKYAPEILRAYACAILKDENALKESLLLANIVYQYSYVMEEWARTNGNKYPDMPKGTQHEEEKSSTG